MKKCLCALWIICAALVIAGCEAGTPDAELSKKAQSSTAAQETAGAAEAAKEEAVEAPVKEAADTKKSEAEADAQEDGSAEEKKEEKEEKASEEPVKKAEEEKKTEKSAEKTKEEKAKEEKSTEESANKTEEKNKEEKKKAEETEKKQEEKEEKRELPPQYMPDGFTPYGNYVLVYDDGYEVKTRLSPAGLTYYYGSEEFLFTLNKDLPDMKNEIAHILFNNAAPMDPGNTEGEEFPFLTPYMIYINLDDGSYYEVSSSWLDLDGRVFARDIFELFRQKWEGAF
jgi:chemotaxis protein histidine kinase CheA